MKKSIENFIRSLLAVKEKQLQRIRVYLNYYLSFAGPYDAVIDRILNLKSKRPFIRIIKWLKTLKPFSCKSQLPFQRMQLNFNSHAINSFSESIVIHSNSVANGIIFLFSCSGLVLCVSVATCHPLST